MALSLRTRLRRVGQGLFTVGVLAALALAGGLLLSPASSEAVAPAQGPVQPPSAREGRLIYAQNCAPCHGNTGWGDGPAAAELPNPATAFADPAVARAAVPADWFEVTKNGRIERMMPPWRDQLSDQEIWDAVAYALSLHTTPAELAQGQQVWEAQCADCHGLQGQGNGPQALEAGWTLANLADPDYAAQHSLEAWHQVTRQGKGHMPAFEGVLAQDAIWNAVAYARTFSFAPVVPVSLPRGEGVIRGVVTNDTQGGAPVAGLQVTLLPFLGSDELPPLVSAADGNGAFAFAGLPTGPDYTYLLTTEYSGVEFASAAVTLHQAAQQEVRLPVYEPSSTPGQIRIALAQWFVDYEPGSLLVGELYRVEHVSDRAFVGAAELAPGKREVLRFPLPAGYRSLAVEGGEIGDRFLLADAAVVDTRPLPPGVTQYLLRYRLPYQGNRVDLAHRLAYPASQVRVLVGPGPEVRSSVLQRVGVQPIGDREFTDFRADSLPANQVISLQFRNLSRVRSDQAFSTAVLAYSPALLFGLGGAAAVSMLALLALAVIARPRRAGPSAVAGAPTDGAWDPRLLQAIADLDDRHAAGELDDEDYAAQRAALKRALIARAGLAASTADRSQPSGSAGQPA
ncbi:MAG: c-type cytochrome [Caldilineales bacterium]|nr:c-type cytochrome [Caldilineales bacterium]MDW8316641.1 c-type cytochrome [Anaerolineae bacterium]